MIMLLKLEDAIHAPEKRKNDLLAKIKQHGWKDDHPCGPKPEKRVSDGL